MIPDEIQRLIYQFITGGKVVIIAPNDEHAAEYFAELRKAVVIAADELRTILGEAEREIICGRSKQEVIGIFGAQEAMNAMGDEFKKTAEAMFEAFRGTFANREPMGLIDEYYETIKHLDKSTVCNKLLKKWNQFRGIARNNYRKLQSLPLICRLRCRWRPRESRRSLEGLSPGIVVIVDELHEWSREEQTQ